MSKAPESHQQKLTDREAALLFAACDLLRLALKGHVVALFIDTGMSYPWFIPIPGTDVTALVRECKKMDWDEVARANPKIPKDRP